MARDDTSPSDVPVEGVSNRPLAPAPAVEENRSTPAKLDGPLTSAHIIHSIPGRVRLRVPTLKAGSQLVRGLEVLLLSQPGITEATVNTGCHSVTVVYDSAVWTSQSLCMFSHSRSREELEQYASVALAVEATSQSSMNWLQPWRYLNLTGASSGSQGEPQTGEQVKSAYWRVGYASMVVGAILVPVPLVPGIPFLILASYCFAKATMWKPGVEPDASDQVPKVKE